MTNTTRPLTDDTVIRLLLDTDPYLSCDDCFALVDTYVEALLADPTYDRPAMRVHLAGCVACAEEARSLVELAAADAGTDPTPALRMLGG